MGGKCSPILDILHNVALDRLGLPVNDAAVQDQVAQAVAAVPGEPGEPAAPAPAAAPAVPPWEAKIAQQQAKEAAKAEAAAAGEMDQRVVMWDYRNLVAERLRAEAGADMAHSAAAGEAIRLKDSILDRKNVEIKKVEEAIKTLPNGLDEALATAADEAAVAKESAGAVQLAVKAAKASIGPTLRSTRAKALAAIEAAAVPLASEEAQLYAKRAHWDKPDVWGRVLANKAAGPYSDAMTQASLRAAQYETYAKQILKEARAVQQQGIAMRATVEEEKKAGNIPESIKQASRMTILLANARSLEQEAQYYWKVASKAWKSIPVWQNAAAAAAATVSRAYQFEGERPAGA